MLPVTYYQYIAYTSVLLRHYLFLMIFSKKKKSQLLQAAARDSELSCRLIKAGGFLDNWSIDVIKANQAWPYSFPITKAAPD